MKTSIDRFVEGLSRAELQEAILWSEVMETEPWPAPCLAMEQLRERFADRETVDWICKSIDLRHSYYFLGGYGLVGEFATDNTKLREWLFDRARKDDCWMLIEVLETLVTHFADASQTAAALEEAAINKSNDDFSRARAVELLALHFPLREGFSSILKELSQEIPDPDWYTSDSYPSRAALFALAKIGTPEDGSEKFLRHLALGSGMARSRRDAIAALAQLEPDAGRLGWMLERIRSDAEPIVAGALVDVVRTYPKDTVFGAAASAALTCDDYWVRCSIIELFGDLFAEHTGTIELLRKIASRPAAELPDYHDYSGKYIEQPDTKLAALKVLAKLEPSERTFTLLEKMIPEKSAFDHRNEALAELLSAHFATTDKTLKLLAVLSEEDGDSLSASESHVGEVYGRRGMEREFLDELANCKEPSWGCIEGAVDAFPGHSRLRPILINFAREARNDDRSWAVDCLIEYYAEDADVRQLVWELATDPDFLVRSSVNGKLVVMDFDTDDVRQVLEDAAENDSYSGNRMEALRVLARTYRDAETCDLLVREHQSPENLEEDERIAGDTARELARGFAHYPGVLDLLERFVVEDKFGSGSGIYRRAIGEKWEEDAS